MTGQQLKNSILQWAIQGKLVPQIASEGTAEELLKEIRAEKEKLVKEGKLKKKDLEVKPIEEDEIPFEIPESWRWCRLGEVFDVRDGTHDTPNYVESGYPLITSKDFDGDKFDLSKTKYISEIDYKEISKRSKVDIGDILYSMIGGNIGNQIDITEENYFEMAIKNVALFKAVNSKIMDNSFLSFFLRANIITFKQIALGGAQSFVGLNVFRQFPFALPPLSEQHRIVAKIEELMPLVEEYGKAQERLETLNKELPEKLKKSVLQEAIMGKLVPQDPKEGTADELLAEIRKEKERLVKEGKLKKKDLEVKPIGENEVPFEVPESWKWVRLGEIGSWGAGATPSKGNPAFYSKGTIPWLTTGELNNGHVSDSKIYVSDLALQKCSLRLCEIGDVLVAMYGATIGKVAIADARMTTNQACCACTPLKIYNEYLFYFIMASKDRLIELGEGGAQPNISREKIVAFPFPLPPLAEQKRIVAKVEEVMERINLLLDKNE